MQDNKKMRDERQRAKENRAKYTSIGSGGLGGNSISSRGNMDSISSSDFGNTSSRIGFGSDQARDRIYGNGGSLSGGSRNKCKHS